LEEKPIKVVSRTQGLSLIFLQTGNAPLFDYLAARKPILFIGKGPPANIISELNIGEATEHSSIKIVEALLKMIGNISKYVIIEEKLKQYRSSSVAKKIVDVFDFIKKNESK
jgi:hypothetical protein